MLDRSPFASRRVSGVDVSPRGKRGPSRRMSAAALVAIVMSLMPVAKATADDGGRYRAPTLVSIPTPQDCAGTAQQTALRPANEPREPVVAVNPTDPNNIVVAYIVDGNVTDLIRMSRDGGRTWSTRQVAPCGSPLDGSADPSLAFSADGKVLYYSALAGSGPATDQVVIYRSLNGGRTWGAPSVVSPADGLRTDMNFITSDPSAAATAYITFERHDVPEAKVSRLYFSRTDDAGATWSAPAVVYQPESGLSSTAGRILPANGSLVDVFQRVVQIDAPYEDNVVMASRSSDGGKTWSAPVKITNRTSGQATGGGPDCGLYTMPQSTISPDGTMYVTSTLDARDERTANTLATDLAVFSSTDGSTWSRIGDVVSPGMIGMSTIAATSDGTLGMTYYQTEDQTCSDHGLADVWFARSPNNGRTWISQKIAGPFDVHGDCWGVLVGTCAFSDYDGLASVGSHALAATFEMTAPQAVNGPSDIFLSLLTW